MYAYKKLIKYRKFPNSLTLTFAYRFYFQAQTSLETASKERKRYNCNKM